MQDQRYEPRANDVWALGILLCKMLGIPHPYNGGDDDTSSAFRARIVLQQPLYELEPNHLVPGGVHEVIVGMLERDPRHRMTVSRARLQNACRRATGVAWRLTGRIPSADPGNPLPSILHIASTREPYFQSPLPEPPSRSRSSHRRQCHRGHLFPQVSQQGILPLRDGHQSARSAGEPRSVLGETMGRYAWQVGEEG